MGVLNPDFTGKIKKIALFGQIIYIFTEFGADFLKNDDYISKGTKKSYGLQGCTMTHKEKESWDPR